MKKLQKELIDYIVLNGKGLISQAGKIQDIGVKKQFLTAEDIRIERGIKEIIFKSSKDHQFYSEEENDEFIDGESVWIVDPISGTKRFIEGLPHYAVVCSHLNKGIVDFAVVYDPTDDNLYTANEEGSFLNGALLKSGKALKKIIYAPSYEWKAKDEIESLRSKLAQKYEIFPSQGSFAYNYCLVAENKFDGVVSFTKDSFPEFAGLFIANSAGAIATNINGEKNLHHEDRIFVCGKKEIYNDLFKLTKSMIR